MDEQNQNTLVVETENRTTPKPKKKHKKILIIISVIVLALMVGIGGVYVYQYTHPSDAVQFEEQIKAKLGQLEDKSNEEKLAALNEIVQEGELKISINASPVFATGDSEGDLRIENHPNNLYEQRVVITLDDTGEEIYHSGPMPINSNIYSDKLEVDLDAGEYKATALFTAYDPETDIEVGQASANITITVLG